jgi:hypothetical protein
MNQAVDINKQDSITKETGLIKAVLNENLNIVELLIESGANTRLKDIKKNNCFDYLRKRMSKVYTEDSKTELKSFYQKLKNANQQELKQITLRSLFGELNNGHFFIKNEHLIKFALIDIDQMIKDANMDDVFMVYFIGFEFNEKIICDVINVLKDLNDVLISPFQSSLTDFLVLYTVNIETIQESLASEETRIKLIDTINLKICLINEFQLIIESKKDSLLKLSNVIFQRDETNKIESPLNEIDGELENILDNELIENFSKEKGFSVYGLKKDENCLFRALSDEFFGTDKLFLTVRGKISQDLKQSSDMIDDSLKKIELLGNFQENEILKAFSNIYDCKINIYQVKKELIAIKNNRTTREINILYHKGQYSSLRK